MPHAGFVHLRVHSAYSLSQGAIHIADLAARVSAEDMPAVAVTDSSNLFGALEFSDAMWSKGIQPIVGCALPLKVPELEDVPEAVGVGHARNAAPGTIALLAQSEEGYGHLLKLVRRAHLDSDPGDPPHICLEDLENHNVGLIALTGGADGPLGRLLQVGRDKEAENLLIRLSEIFGDRLYMEIMRHGMAMEEATEEALLDLAYAHDIPLVATNDAQFLDAEMYEAHDALLCIAAGTYVSEAERPRLTPEHRFKSAAEMEALFADLPEAIENTLNIARRTAFRVRKRDPILPNFAQDSGLSEADMLRQQATEGLAARFASDPLLGCLEGDALEAKRKEYGERLDFELDVIIEMGFPGYFLIVADFMHWARNNGVPVGPGRGSGAGSLVAWSLLITDLDPIRFGLLFERFLNPERVSMPDFDIDFCQDKRDRVIRYVQEKYGADQVAQIITFGKLQARAVLRDVGRVLQQPYPVTDRLCKMVPNNPANPVTLAEAIESEPRLRAERDNDEQTAAVIDRALKLEGLYRHASTHAAGVVIGDRPLDELIPLYRDPRSDMPVTGFNMKWVEKAGLVKFDFLGLKTLTVLQKAVDYIAEREIQIDLATIPLDDPATFAMLCSGDTAGVFQLESSGMRSVLRGLKPDKFEDIIALVALYRPGPMDNIPTYVNRKHGVEEVEYLHEWLTDVLAETYGVIIYQEQVMQIAQILAGYSLGEADLLRRAMGKKIKAEMDAQQKRFVDGAVAKGVSEERAYFIFDLVAKFAGYGFNKSHAAAYALVAYQTAYLKANYPVEFMAATMSLDQHNTDKLGAFRMELTRAGIPLLPPDINRSGATFTVEPVEPEDEGEAQEADDPRAGRGIRYGLAAIKNVGEKAMEDIVAERQSNGPYKDLFDLAERIDPKAVNKRQLENLTAAGALDCLNPDRAQSMEAVGLLTRYAQSVAEQRESAQESLFGEAGNAAVRPPLPKVATWNETEKLEREHAAIGFYMSSHPLDMYRELLDDQQVVDSVTALSSPDYIGKTVRLAGVISGLQERRSQKSGKPFGYLALSDSAGGYEGLVFSDLLESARTRVEDGGPVIVVASIDRRDDEELSSLMLREIRPLEPAAQDMKLNLDVFLRDAVPLQGLRTLLDDHRGGRGRVLLRLRTGDGESEVAMALDGQYRVTPQVRSAVASIEGVVHTEVNRV